MKPGNLLIVFLLFSFLLPGGQPSLSQSSHKSGELSKDVQTREKIVVDVDLVNVSFAARDKKGRLVTDLTKEELKMFENDKPQTITYFSRETDLPLAVALLIDTSTSIRDKLKVEQEAAIDFFHTTLRRKKDKGLLMSFDSIIEVLQDFTDDADLLTKAVRKLKPGGGTKMFDAIHKICLEKLQNEPDSKKVLILISDGDDNMSFETLESVVEIAQRAVVSIFTISTNTSGFFGMESPKYDKILKKLAEETGGRAFFPPKIDDLAKSFQDISQELRSEYSLAFRPSHSDEAGAFRTIKLESTRKGVKLRARKGYYPPRASRL